MRSPGATFDLRAALSDEVRAALEHSQHAPKPKAVHRCRVHLKRARALARLGRDVAPGLSSVFNDSARALMHAMSAPRDLAALSFTARGIAKRATRKQAKALRRIADDFDRRADALPPLDLDALAAGLRDLMAMAQVWPEASSRQIQKGALRIVRRARKAQRAGEGSRLPARRHEWRKRVKDRLYAVILLEDAWPVECPRRRKANERLGEALGLERDALLLADALTHEPGPAGADKAAKRAEKAVGGRLWRLSRRADGLGARLHKGGA